jgi:hypothetical protein
MVSMSAAALRLGMNTGKLVMAPAPAAAAVVLINLDRD